MICIAISRKTGKKYLRYLEELAKSDVVLQPSFLLPELLGDAEHSTYKGQLPVPCSFYLNELTKSFVVIPLAKISSFFRNGWPKYSAVPRMACQKYSATW
jgi:hypothetical protein